MDPNFWKAAWLEGRTGFHEGKANRYLERHAARLGQGTRVLVPLCGKTYDLVYLAQRGHPVVGVELSELAARAFFAEQKLTVLEAEHGEFLRLSSRDVTIFVGDFFATTPDLIGACTAFYDRAALVALPPELREAYAAHLLSLLPAEPQGLLVTFEYPEGALEAPPFSVHELEVEELFAAWEPELLEREASDSPRLVAAGVPVSECVYALAGFSGVDSARQRAS